MLHDVDPDRRALMRAAAAVPLLCLGQSALAEDFHAQGFWERPRYVWMTRPATGEQIKVTYWADGQLVQDAYARLSWFMRDVRMHGRIAAAQRAGHQVPAGWFAGIGMSLVLLDIIYAVNGWLEYHQLSRPLILTSGFRHRLTNDATEGSARNSRHVVGGAADIVIPGVSATSVARFSAWLSAGGVGFYPGRSFTHVDDGRLRVWRG